MSNKIKEISIYVLDSRTNLCDIKTIADIDGRWVMSTNQHILNENKNAVELIGLSPLFVETDSSGTNYATLPDKPVIRGKWLSKSKLKKIGVSSSNREIYVADNSAGYI